LIGKYDFLDNLTQPLCMTNYLTGLNVWRCLYECTYSYFQFESLPRLWLPRYKITFNSVIFIFNFYTGFFKFPAKVDN